MSASDGLYARYLKRERLPLIDFAVGLDGDMWVVESVDSQGRRRFNIHDRRYPYPPVGEVFVYPEHEFEGPLPDHMLAKLRGEVAS